MRVLANRTFFYDCKLLGRDGIHQGDLWQAGQLAETGSEVKSLGGSVQSGDVHTITSNQGTSQANQGSDKSPLAASQDVNQAVKHLEVAAVDPSAPLTANSHARSLH